MNNISDSEIIRDVAEALRSAREMFDDGQGDPARQRIACVTSLFAVWRILLVLPIPKSDLLPFTSLVEALIDTSRGGSHELLTPNQSRGGQPLSTEHLFLQATSVSLTQILINAGWSEKESKQKVATALAKHGLVSGRRKKPITPSMIHNWRSKLASGDAEGLAQAAELQIEHTKLLGTMLNLSWPMNREAADDLISKLPKAIWPVLPRT